MASAPAPHEPPAEAGAGIRPAVFPVGTAPAPAGPQIHAPNADIPPCAGRRVDADDVNYLRHMQMALASGRSNRHFRINKSHGRVIRKSNMSDGAMADTVWSLGEIHTSAAAQEYMSMLDAKRAATVIDAFEDAWPDYGEAVRNRKRCIVEVAMHYVGRAGIGQAVILGAGYDALSLEIASRSGRAFASYEVDAAAMPYKRDVLYRVGDRSAAGSVRCITADLAALTPRRLGTALSKEGWDYDRPSLVVAEGITQYLPKSKLAALLSLFRTPDRSSRIIMEYIRDEASIDPGRAGIPELLLGWHGTMIGVDRLSRYSDAQALDFAAGGTGRGGRAGVKAAGAAGMGIIGPALMEKARTGDNAYFPSDRSGWFAVCHGPI